MKVNPDIGKKAVIGTLWLTATNYINFAISFGSGIVLARILMPSDFGMVALAVSLLGLFQMLGGWGFDVAIIKEEKDIERIGSTLLTLIIMVTLGILGLVLLSSIILRDFYAKKIITIFLIIASVDTLRIISHIPGALIQKSLLLKRGAIIGLLATSISSGIAIIMAVNGFGIWSLVFLQITSSIVFFIATFLLCPYKIRLRFEKEIVKDFFSFGKHLFTGSVLENFLIRADKIVVGTVLGSAILGLYNRGYTMSTMFEQWISPGIKTASLPTLSNVKQDNIVLSKTFTLLLRSITRMVVPFYLVMGLLAAEIVIFLYGEKWWGTISLFRLLIPYGILSAVFEISKILHFSLGDSKTVAKTRVVQALFFLISIVAFVHFWGAAGVCICLDGMLLIGVILLMTSAKRKVAFNYFNIFGTPALAGFISFLFFILLNPIIHITGNLNRIIFYLIISSVVFIGFSYIFEGEKLKTDFQTIFRLLRRA